MSVLEPTGPNADQIAFWTGAQAWVAQQELLDEQLGPLGLAGMQTLAPRPGETILDVGCGCGATTLELAGRVAPGGAVTGVDISAPMLAVAEARAGGRARFLLADAQTHALPAANGVFSRFGVMFFADPAAAFANIRMALEPGGRVVFVCWRSLAENHWMSVPFAAAAPFLPPMPAGDPNAPGPFAFADADRVRRILAAAGYSKIEIEPHDERIGSSTVERAMQIVLGVGPLSRALREHPEARAPATAAVAKALEPHEGPDGVKLDSAVWIVRAS